MSSDIIVYDYSYIQKLSNKLDTVLDETTRNILMEIKKNNKFISRTSPLKLKYKMSIADAWRQKREHNICDVFKNSIIVNLNKLTDSNYAQILTVIMDICTTSEYDKEILTNTICTKAMTENIYAHLYARLIYDLQKEYSIKELVIYECNIFFENNSDINIAELANMDDYEELCSIIKTKSNYIGAFVFITNLYIYDTISQEIMENYFNSLVSYIEASPIEYIGKYIDALSTILDKCGKKLQDKYKGNFSNTFMDIFYKLPEKKKLSNKYKFKLLDIRDKYENNWDPIE